jgi:tetratricopeptide (TPR) repeat protein
MNKMKKLLLLTIGFSLFLPGYCLGTEKPFANDGKRGLYATSLDEILRLSDEEIDLATAALIASEQWSDIVEGLRYRETVDNMARDVQDMIAERRPLSPQSVIAIVNEYLFEKQGFQSTSEISAPDELFLHKVLDNKRGYCLGLSVLYLSLAERLGLPIYGVVAPGHFFVRYDDGRELFNIETTSRGGYAPDEHYITEFKVPQAGDDTIYMRNLTNLETLGCFFNNLGNSYHTIGDVDTAMAVLERAVQINPSLAEARMNLGNIYLKKGRVDEAIYQYRASLQINPDDAKAHLNLGNAYSERDWLSDAINEYHLSLKLDPNFIDTYRNLATVYSRQKRFNHAYTYLEHALALDPQNSDLHSQMGDACCNLGYYDRALAQYEKALNLKPNSAVAYYGMGLCYNKMGKADEEIEAYKKALEIDPDMVGALVNLGNVFFARHDYETAIKHYKKAAAIKTNDATTYYNLGAAYSNKGDYIEAVAAHKKAVQLDPKMGDAHNGLAYCYYWLEDYDLAWEHIKTAERLGAGIDKKLLTAIKSKRR